MPRAIGKASDIDACGLTLSELQELWLGPNPSQGSLFRDRAELEAAWAQGRAVVMRLWGTHGRRPLGWWEFEAGDLKHPGYFRERSYLYEHNVLSEAERTELEAQWREDFDAARGMDARARREHYEHHDIPAELIERWKAERRRPKRQGVPSEEPVAAK